MSACPRCESTEHYAWGHSTLKDGTRVKIFKCKNCGKHYQGSYHRDRVKTLKVVTKTVRHGGRGRPKRIFTETEVNDYCVNVYGKTLRFKEKGERLIVLKTQK